MPLFILLLSLAPVLGLCAPEGKWCIATDVEDIQTVPQDIKQYKHCPPLRTHKRENRFAVWTLHQKDFPKPESFQNAKLYRLNYHLLPHPFYERLVQKCSWQHLNTLCQPCFVTHPTPLRELPIEEPLFDNPQKAGEGYPFDQLQRSYLMPCRPLLLSHYSDDGLWAYVYASLTEYGWVLKEHIACASPKTQRFMRTAHWAVITQDNTVIKTSKGPLYCVNIGAFFPIAQQTKKGIRISVPSACGTRWHTARALPETQCQKYPLPWNVHSVHTILDRLQKGIYGWGMLEGQRDCSSFLRDFFATFGVHLPRNSFHQQEFCQKEYHFIDVSSLPDEEKLSLLREKGIPYQTVLFRKGHVGLYVGCDQQNRPIMLHDIWGIPLKDGTRKGRAVIGKPILSTLTYGKELPFADTDSLFLHQFSGIGILK